MRILVVAGGTGGHIYPAATLADYLKKQNNAHLILWVGGKGELEEKIIPWGKVEFKKISAQPFPRSLSLKWINFILKIVFSLLQSLRYILTFKPDVVVGMGSFHSYPVTLAAFLCGIPVVLCEQNIYLSLTNRMLLPLASEIALSFSSSRNYLPFWGKKKAVVTGNPVREEIITTSKEEGIKKLDLEEGKFTLLFLGGSQGAHFLNKVAIETLHLLEEGKIKNEVQFILITGEKDYPWVRDRIREIKLRGKVFPFLSQIHYAYAASDLVISRSGATTLAEITARGLPCILVPYPFATNEHQKKNALALEKEGGAKVITQERLHPLLLKRSIEEIIQNPELQNKMREASHRWGRPLATQSVANLILQFATNKS